eukprot:UN03852
MKFFAITTILFGLANAGNILDTYPASSPGGECVNYVPFELEACLLSPATGCYGYITCSCEGGKNKKIHFDYYLEDDCSGNAVGGGNAMANGECNLVDMACNGVESQGSVRIDEDDWEAACEIYDCN